MFKFVFWIQILCNRRYKLQIPMLLYGTRFVQLTQQLDWLSHDAFIYSIKMQLVDQLSWNFALENRDLILAPNQEQVVFELVYQELESKSKVFHDTGL